MKKIVVIAMMLAPVLAMAQEKKVSEKQQKKAERRERVNQLIKQEEEGALIFQKQSAFAVKLNTDGYGIFYEHGKYKTITKTNLWWLELGERKHGKEEKVAKGIAGLGIVTGNPFVFGKVNNLYNFNIGIGQQRLIGGKGNKNGIAVSLMYGGGLSMALVKPYYLSVEDGSGGVKDIKYADDSTTFLDPNKITGASSFGKGFGEMKYIPGAHVRAALRFDYGRYNEVLSAVEVGLNATFYSKKIEQMAYNKQKDFFFNAYVAIVFGRRK